MSPILNSAFAAFFVVMAAVAAAGPPQSGSLKVDTKVFDPGKPLVTYDLTIKGQGTVAWGLFKCTTPPDAESKKCKRVAGFDEEVMFVATPKTGWRFYDWDIPTDRCDGDSVRCIFRPSASGLAKQVNPILLEAYFIKEPPESPKETIAVEVPNSGGRVWHGVFASGPINCFNLPSQGKGGTCSATFPQNKTIELVADPEPGMRVDWEIEHKGLWGPEKKKGGGTTINVSTHHSAIVRAFFSPAKTSFALEYKTQDVPGQQLKLFSQANFNCIKLGIKLVGKPYRTRCTAEVAKHAIVSFEFYLVPSLTHLPKTVWQGKCRDDVPGEYSYCRVDVGAEPMTIYADFTTTPAIAQIPKRKIFVTVSAKPGQQVVVRIEGANVPSVEKNCNSGCTFDAYDTIPYNLSAKAGSTAAAGSIFQGVCAGTAGQICTLPANGDQKVSLFF
jgi:hypothetical protein